MMYLKYEERLAQPHGCGRQEEAIKDFALHFWETNGQKPMTNSKTACSRTFHIRVDTY